MNNALTASPQFDYSALDRAGLAPTSLIKYKAAIKRLVDSGISPFNHEALANYANSLPHSGRAFLKSALRVMVREYEQMLKANATSAHISDVQVMLWRLEAMNNAIQVHAAKGKGASIWLTREQVEQITSLPDRTTIQGRRDWIVLATILGAGLRRSEMATLTFSQLKRQPMKNGQLRGVLDIIGKGSKKRVIPISPILEQHLREWKKETGGGRVARGFIKGGAITESLSDKSISEEIVKKYGALIGLPELEAHDLRRTWAQLGLNAGIPITQISVLLGHSNVAITQRYLDLQIDLESTISDHIPLSGD